MSGMPVARFNDIAVGICYSHPPIPNVVFVGVLSQGSPNTNTNSLRTARRTDFVCGCHYAYISTSSNTVICNNLGVGRKLDQVSGTPNANIMTGSPNTFAGD